MKTLELIRRLDKSNRKKYRLHATQICLMQFATGVIDSDEYLKIMEVIYNGTFYEEC